MGTSLCTMLLYRFVCTRASVCAGRRMCMEWADIVWRVSVGGGRHCACDAAAHADFGRGVSPAPRQLSLPCLRALQSNTSERDAGFSPLWDFPTQTISWCFTVNCGDRNIGPGFHVALRCTVQRPEPSPGVSAPLPYSRAPYELFLIPSGVNRGRVSLVISFPPQ